MATEKVLEKTIKPLINVTGNVLRALSPYREKL